MASPPSHRWQGASLSWYEYFVYPWPQTFDAGQHGNYIFAKRDAQKPWQYVALYIGETEDLGTRLDQHHKLECALDHGMTHVHVKKSSSEKLVRTAEESDLVKA